MAILANRLYFRNLDKKKKKKFQNFTDIFVNSQKMRDYTILSHD